MSGRVQEADLIARARQGDIMRDHFNAAYCLNGPVCKPPRYVILVIMEVSSG